MPFLLKSFFWNAHRWVGLIAGTIFLLTVTSGFAMMFQKDLNLENAAPLGREPATLDGLSVGVANLEKDRPDMVVRYLLPPPDKVHAWRAFISPRSGNLVPHSLISLDPATGEILSDIDYDSTTKGWLLSIHNGLLTARAGYPLVGEIVMLGVAVGLVFLSISGFTILRRRWRTLRTNPFTVPGNRWRAVHRWAGSIGAVLIIVWGITGFLILLPYVIAGLGGANKVSPIVSAPVSASLQAALTQDAVTREGEIFNVGMPSARAPEITVTMLRRSALPWNKLLQLKLDAKTGAIVKRIPPEDQPSFLRWSTAEKAIHQGLYETIPVHILYMLAAMIPLTLAISGPIGWWRRLAAQRLKRSSAKQEAVLGTAKR